MAETENTSEDMPVIGLDDDRAEAVMDALSSPTAKEIYATLQDEPATVSDLAAEIDASVQTVHHHMKHLREEGLVHVKDHQYSAKGKQMNVYEAAEQPMIVLSVSEEQLEKVKRALKYALGTAGVLAGAAVVVDRFGPGQGPSSQTKYGEIGSNTSPGITERAIDTLLANPLEVTAIIILVGAAGFIGYHWYRRRKQP